MRTGILPRRKIAKDETGFATLERFQRQIDTLRNSHQQSLEHYYNSTKGGFWHKFKDSAKSKISKASTSTCLLSLVGAGLWTESQKWYLKSQGLFNEIVSSLFDGSAGLSASNPFTISFLLEAALVLKANIPTLKIQRSQTASMSKAVGILIDSLEEAGCAAIENYPPTTYLTQLVIRTLRQCDSALVPNAKRGKEGLNGGLPARIKTLTRTWSWQQLLYEMGLFSSASKSADPFALAYAIILFATLSDLAEIAPPRKQILRTAIDQVFAAQLADGSWPRSRPLFHYKQVGNAYCFEYEMLTQFLGCDTLQEYFLRHLPGLHRTVEYLGDSAFDLGKGRLGWASGHHPQLEGPESWSTAAAFHFLHQLGRVLAEAIRREVFQFAEVPYVPIRPPKDRPELFASFPNFLDAPLHISGQDHSLRDEILQRFVLPLVVQLPVVKQGLPLPRKKVPLSLLMFGPPGTSKTSLAEFIAEYLGWSFLSIDPSNIVSGGWDRIHATATALFKRLAALEQTVIFLDEFDEMVRERQEKESQPVSRFFTTVMLPQLAAINRKRRSVLIVATNHVEAFDAAILRRGRFDLVVQVMPPSTKQKLKKWSDLRKRLNGINFKITAERARKIEALTYSEFEEMVPAMVRCKTIGGADKELNRSFEQCTLQQRIIRQLDLKDDSTWQQACDSQREFIRVPTS